MRSVKDLARRLLESLTAARHGRAAAILLVIATTVVLLIAFAGLAGAYNYKY